MTSTLPRTSRGRRLLGVDAARGVALIGMMSVHLVPATTGAGVGAASVSSAFLVASGRASALFAVLAGVSLALATGAAHPPTGTALAAARRSVAARAGVVAAVGMTLGLFPTGLAIILVHYGLLFCVALPFLGCRTRTLVAWATGWLLLSPLLAHVLRAAVDVDRGPQPSWAWLLLDPVSSVVQVGLTGYYPVLQWTGYLLVGLAVGRSGLRAGGAGRRSAVALLAGGTALALAAKGASWLLLGPLGGREALQTAVPPGSTVASTGLDVSLLTGMFGTTPTTSWWWLAVSAPHSGTSLDLLHTTGTALAVLGAALLTAGVAERAGIVVSGLIRVLGALGSVPFTVYTAHALARMLPDALGLDVDPYQVLAVHVLVAAVAATLVRASGRRGPLEALAAAASRAAPAPRER